MTVQRLYQAATGIVAGNGKVTIKFQPSPTLQMWTGMVNVYNATGSESWQAQVGGAPWGTFLGNAQFGPIQAHGGETISVIASGLVAGTVYNAALIGTSSAEGEVPYASPQIQQLTLAQIASTVTAAISGNVSTFGAQEHLTNSPFSFTGSPQTQSFPLPAGGPSLDGLILVPYASNAGQTTGNIKVVGNTTGVTYLNTAISQNPFVCDFSSSADTGGVSVTFSLLGGAGNNFKLGVVGLNRSQLVRPIHGGLAEGPALVAFSQVANGASGTFFQVPSNGQYRIWLVQLNMSATLASQENASIAAGAQTLAALTTLSTSASPSVTNAFEGGLPIGSLVSVTVSAPTNGVANGLVAYSVDA